MENSCRASGTSDSQRKDVQAHSGTAAVGKRGSVLQGSVALGNGWSSIRTAGLSGTR